MKYYIANQNNSGGSFVLDKERGLTHWVIIEAENYNDAEEKFLSIGGYCNGCENDIDCQCCGDRWYELDEKEKPEIYNKSIKEYLESDSMKWMEEGFEVCLHRADSTKEWY